MKRLIAAAIFLAALCVSAPAQWNGCQPGLCAPATGAAPTYVGPGDVVSSASAWYGLRAYNAADRGNKLADICDAAKVPIESDWCSANGTRKL